ncbi:MAG: ferritin-like domain-containing protein [Candidatus Poseidoniaceae archaeon]|nr:ferritin-like domain-containing protein [Candidatus Poseidoniaceae archaeon]|tara:strand:- start:84 stop:509 length:426 start_codon:yes stop_codon:yes gene_type:complete
MTNEHIIEKMNLALGWELRAVNMYAHYSANVRGIHRLQLSPLFNTEMTESLTHADIVRKAIVQLGGVPVTERNSHPIIHTTNYIDTLNYSLETEAKAAEVYAQLLELIGKTDEQDLYDSIEQIYLSELRSLEELRLVVTES